MDVSSLLSWHRMRPRVVHSLAGRVRIHIPILLDVPRSRQDLSRLLIRLVRLLPGIESVTVSFASGNLLVQYAADQRTEKEVLGWVHSLAQILLRHRKRLAVVSADEVPAVADRLSGVLERAIQHQLTFDKDIEIPDDVWP